MDNNKPSIIKKRPLWLEIFAFFAGLLVFSVLVIVWNTYKNNSNAVLSLSDDLMGKVTEIVVFKTGNYMEPAATVTRFTASIPSILENGIIGNDDLENYSIKVLKYYKQYAMFNFGDEKGNFVMLKKMNDGTIATKIINRNNDPVTVTWKYRNVVGKVIKNEVLPYDNYDPRLRPWYIGAKKTGDAYWTDPYVFFTDKKIGVSASYPVFSKNKDFLGVIGIDIDLDLISKFLKKLRIGKTGAVILINNSDQIFAYRDVSKIIRKDGDKFRPVNVNEFEEEWIKQAVLNHKKSNVDKFNYKFNGKKYIASLSKISESFGNDWKIVVVVPEDDFLGPLRKTNKLTVGFAFMILLFGVVIATMISKRVSRPIMYLTENIRKLGQGDLDVKLDVGSQMETAQLALAFNKMSDDLTLHIQELKKSTAKNERFKTELDIAAKLQRSLLPVESPDIKNFDIAGTSIPALEVGGDYYGYINFSENELGVGIGDAAGKGLGAAMFVASCRAANMAISMKTQDLPTILEITNNLLVKDAENNYMFVTFFASILHSKERAITYSNAGHNPPILIRADSQKIEELTEGGIVMGIFKDSQYEAVKIQLEVGDLLFYFTDGVIEAKSPENEFFGKEYLIKLLKENMEKSASEILSLIKSEVFKFTDIAEQFDDVTMIVVKVV
ncbi:SpoIIE family protein phosphatase [bacterium]|nr:SpoIIE family protein phosphatase [bacterium]